MSETQNKFSILLIYLVLAMTTFAVFYQVRCCDFVNYDDDKYVTENRHVRSGLTLENVTWAFTSGYAANWHPLTWLSHMLDYQLFGLNPDGHHLTNLLFHIINTLLLFTILRRMTNAIWPSAFVAGLFALHPLHVESVAWVAERKDLLSTMFWFLTMIAYVRYAKRPGITQYLITLVLFALGLMAKPMLVTLPFVLLLLDYWPLERLEKKTLYNRILEKIPFLALSAASSVITFLVQRGGGAVIEIQEVFLHDRINNTFVSYLTYIAKMVWPARLAVFYPHFVDITPAWQVLAAFLLLMVVSVWVVLLAAKHKYLFVGWFWYLGTLIPVIGLVQVGAQAWADRYSYVPLTGLFIMVAWGFQSLLRKSPVQKLILVAMAVVIFSAVSLCTGLQLRYWRNSITLFERALAVTKNNYVAHYSLGRCLFRQGKIDQAVAHYYEALRITEYPLAHAGLGVVFAQQGKLDEAIEQFRYVEKADPKFDEVYYNLGVAFAAQGKYEDALEQYRKAVELNPDYVMAYNNMGAVLFFQGKLDKAVNCYQKVLKLEPDYAEAHNNLGAALSAQGKLDEAVSQFNQALQLNPNAANAHTNLGYALARQGNLEKAIAHLSLAIELNPDFCEAHYYLALVLAQKSQIDEGVKHAEIALKLAQSAGNKQLVEQIQQYLDMYRTGQPCIEPVTK